MDFDEVPDAEGVDHLYEIDPGDFVVARDQLASQLRAAGHRGAATTVRSLRRPTLVAWAVNQVERAHPDLVGELEEATHAVRRAQEAAVSGGEPGDLREAAQRRRRLVAELARAVAVLAAARTGATSAREELERVRTEHERAQVRLDEARPGEG